MQGRLPVFCWLVLPALMTLLAACATPDRPDDRVDAPAPVYAVLLLGNSHSTKSGLPKKLERLLGSVGPVVIEVAPGWKFLDERLGDTGTEALFRSRAWTHVVLQGQRYSVSGREEYPTDAAEAWVRRVRAAGAVPVLFPEWGLYGNAGESLRVQRLHEAISARAPACIAPIGLAWDVALENRPGLRLYAEDGNHANNRGALLAAYVLYEVITGLPAAGLAAGKGVGVSAGDQAYLGAVATTLMKNKTACPGEHALAGRDGRLQ